MTVLLMALAGGLGAGGRYGLDAWMRPRVSDRLPWPTLLINVTGSFALGLLVGLGTGDTWLMIAGTGLLGGYTTFSTASVETVQLALAGRHSAAAVNALTTLVVSVAAAAVGHLVGAS
ncbi:MAG: CrcB family protein [Aeromicrobium sp.]